MLEEFKMLFETPSTTPAQRAGEIPGIVWESIFNALSYHSYVARTELEINPANAMANIVELEAKLMSLKSFIMDGVRD